MQITKNLQNVVKTGTVFPITHCSASFTHKNPKMTQKKNITVYPQYTSKQFQNPSKLLFLVL